MDNVRNTPTTPDLFSPPAAGGVSPPLPSSGVTVAPTPRHILPRDLPAAVKQLSDGELDQLLEVVTAEQERRGTKKSSSVPPRQHTKADAAAPLTLGKINAVRAAFKAGVSPSRIAREFGLSQSDVRKALAADKATR